MKPLKVLIACERSQVEQQAFALVGCDSWSLDILPAYGPDPSHHIVADAYTFPLDGWDMIVAHPPCQALTHANNARRNDRGRVPIVISALRLWARFLFEAPCPICVENPVGIPNELLPPSQIVSPHQFGEPFRKRTCFWLRGLPPLRLGRVVIDPVPWVDSSRYRGVACKHCPGLSRSAARSQSFVGIASAMASQWSDYLHARRNLSLPSWL